MAKEWSTKPDVVAECLTCGKHWDSRNAHAVGAQHARKHNHSVRIEVSRVHIYDHDPKPHYGES